MFIMLILKIYLLWHQVHFDSLFQRSMWHFPTWENAETDIYM